MNCIYLNTYSSHHKAWQVKSCSARDNRYVPGMAELDTFCTNNHQKCPYFQRTGALVPLHSGAMATAYNTAA